MRDQNMTMASAFAQSLDIQDDHIIEFIPYILQDLWSMGGNPDVAVDLVKWNIPITHEYNIIELGCGKGATIAAMAARLSGQYVGVDIVPEFVAEGIEKIKNENFFSSVQLEAGDLKNVLKKAWKYDVVIYGYESDLLGGISDSIRAVNRIKKNSGYILFEAAFKNRSYAGVEYLSKIELYDEINNAGLEVIDFEIWDRKRQSANHKINNHLIKERLEQLKKHRPKLKELFDEYYFNQVKETKILNTYVDCVTFLLK